MENIELINWVSLVTAATITIAPISYVLKKWWTNVTERKQISKSLHTELKDALYALDGTAGRQVMEIEIDGIKKYYTLTFMNHDMYDSLIFSGKIQSLNIELQQNIQDIFRKIKGHQEYLKYTSQLRDNGKLYKIDVDKTTNPYYKLIADYETELEGAIPKVMEQLEKNF